MKKLFILFLTAIIMSGCTRNIENPKILSVQIPWLGEDGRITLKIVELFSLWNLPELRGQYASFYMGPTVVNNKIHGINPKVRTIKTSSGYYVPTDRMSLELLTIYAHMEKLGKLDQQMGLSSEQMNKIWPIDIGVAVKYMEKNNRIVENNAMYVGSLDALLFVPYTDSSLPISVNPGIIAHEHFHTIFYHLFTEPLKLKFPPLAEISPHRNQNKSLRDNFDNSEIQKRIFTSDVPPEEGSDAAKKLYLKTVIRGLNEGMADFWGWLYTNDPEFIIKSLPKEKTYRELNISGQGIPSSSDLKNLIIINTDIAPSKEFADEVAESVSYDFGTEYARFFKAFTDTYTQSRSKQQRTGKSEIATQLIKAINNFKIKFESLDANTDISTHLLLQVFLEELKDLNTEECALINKTISTSEASNFQFCKQTENKQSDAQEEK